MYTSWWGRCPCHVLLYLNLHSALRSGKPQTSHLARSLAVAFFVALQIILMHALPPPLIFCNDVDIYVFISIELTMCETDEVSAMEGPSELKVGMSFPHLATQDNAYYLCMYIVTRCYILYKLLVGSEWRKFRLDPHVVCPVCRGHGSIYHVLYTLNLQRWKLQMKKHH